MELSKRMRNWDWIHKGLDFSHVDDWADEAEQLETTNADLLEALNEIAKGEGAYSRDPLTHAGNTITSMKNIATSAIRKYEETQ